MAWTMRSTDWSHTMTGPPCSFTLHPIATTKLPTLLWRFVHFVNDTPTSPLPFSLLSSLLDIYAKQKTCSTAVQAPNGIGQEMTFTTHLESDTLWAIFALLITQNTVFKHHHTLPHRTDIVLLPLIPLFPFMSINVLYGSQTGRAADTSYYIAKRLVAEGYGVAVGSLDSFAFEALHGTEQTVLFVVSTTGQGDAPDNMKATWAQLMKKSCPALNALRYSVLCLGDSSYEKYNYIGKMLSNRLGSGARGLGALMFSDKGMCDDQDPNGIEDGLLPWLGSVVQNLGGLERVEKGAAKPGFMDEFHPKYVVKTTTDATTEGVEPQRKHMTLHKATVTKNARMTTPDHFQDVRNIVFSSEALCYEPGSSLGILPRNAARDVDVLLKKLSLNGNEAVSISANTANCIAFHSDPLDGLVTNVRTLLTEHLNINGVPTRYCFGVLASCCPDGPAQKKLHEMSLATEDGREELRFYCTRERRSFLEVLLDFAAVSLTLEVLLDVIPLLQERLYSISSSPTEVGVALTVALVEYKTPYGRAKKGLCSSYLSGLAVGDSLNVSVHEPTVSWPEVGNKMVLIGPGTGIAPCRSIIVAMHALCKEEAEGKLTLVFGCRNRGKDFLYGEEMEALGEWMGYHTAFSRDQEEKCYVQHLMRAGGALQKAVSEALSDEEDGVVYICGSAKDMPKSVQLAIIWCLMQERNLTEDEATLLMQRLKKQKRIQLDTWA